MLPQAVQADPPFYPVESTYEKIAHAQHGPPHSASCISTCVKSIYSDARPYEAFFERYTAFGNYRENGLPIYPDC